MSNKVDIAARNRAIQPVAEPNATVRAKVVFNYGDVGLTESTYFDILSRFLIVMIEDTGRVPTNTNTSKIFVLVKRPRELWIDVDGGVQATVANQLRSDVLGNVNKGSPGSYSINNIPPINKPYALGEQIIIRKMDKPIYFDDTFFSSAYDSSNFTNATTYSDSYLTRDPSGPQSVSNNAANWGTYKILPLFPAAGTRGAVIFGNSFTGPQLAAGLKTFVPSYNTVAGGGAPVTATANTFNPLTQYGIGFNKFQFEVFWRYISPDPTNKVDKLIAGGWKIGDYNDDYMWAYTNCPACSLIYASCGWEDLNVGHKSRIPDNECLPLVVASPNSFPLPKSRLVGAIKFDPTFSQIIVP